MELTATYMEHVAAGSDATGTDGTFRSVAGGVGHGLLSSGLYLSCSAG